MRGFRQQACTQRRNSSASGDGPAKPPTSWPTLNRPDSDICSPVRMFQRKLSQLVVLSPLQLWAYRWMPGGPARLTLNGVASGACCRCASTLARVISSPCRGRARCIGIGWPKPSHRASSSRMAYSLLSFQPASMP